MEEFPLTKIYSIKIELFGSIALTGKGHGSDTAILMGLEGEEPASVDPEQIPNRIKRIRGNKSLCLMNDRKIHFEEEISLIFMFDNLLPHHPNGIRFTVFDAEGTKLREEDRS